MTERFVDNGDGTVTDASTGLMWQRETAPGTYTWQEALEHCAGLDFAGHKDWRLPTVSELVGIVDYGRHGPAIDPVLGAVPSVYWSSSAHVHAPLPAAWIVSFRDGDVGDDSVETTRCFVRAVRSAVPPAVSEDEQRRAAEAIAAALHPEKRAERYLLVKEDGAYAVFDHCDRSPRGGVVSWPRVVEIMNEHSRWSAERAARAAIYQDAGAREQNAWQTGEPPHDRTILGVWGSYRRLGYYHEEYGWMMPEPNTHTPLGGPPHHWALIPVWDGEEAFDDCEGGAEREQNAAGVEARLAKVESDVAGMFEDWAGGAEREPRESEVLSAVHKLTEHMSNLAARVGAQHQRLLKWEDSLADLQRGVAKVEAALSVACEDGKGFDQRIFVLFERVGKVATDIDVLRRELHDTDTNVSGLADRTSKVEVAIERVDGQLDDYRRGLRESCEAAGARDLQVEQDLRDVRKLLDAASARIGALEIWRGSGDWQLMPRPVPPSPWPPYVTPLGAEPTLVRYGVASGTGEGVVWGPPQPLPDPWQPPPPTTTTRDAGKEGA